MKVNIYIKTTLKEIGKMAGKGRRLFERLNIYKNHADIRLMAVTGAGVGGGGWGGVAVFDGLKKQHSGKSEKVSFIGRWLFLRGHQKNGCYRVWENTMTAKIITACKATLSSLQTNSGVKGLRDKSHEIKNKKTISKYYLH